MTEVGAARAVPWRSLGAGAGLAVGVALLAFANGGYFPTGWGWGALVALSLVAVYLVAGEPIRPGWLAIVTVGALGGFAAWTALSLTWSDDVTNSVLENQRVLLYLAAAAALVLLARRPSVPYILAGVLAAVTAAAGYGLASRLFPERLGVYEPTSAYRLGEPLGYWNGLGLFAAMGGLLALGFAVRGRSLPGRILAAAILPVLATTIYFTFSRGAWIAGAVGFLAAVALDPRRLQLLAGAVVLAPASGLAILLASGQDALTRTGAPLSAASREGHRLAVYVVLLVGASALVGAAFAIGQRRLRPGPRLRLAFAGALVLAAVAALGGTFVRYGGPLTLADKAHDSFTKPPSLDPNLNRRLLTFSGSYRSELWQAAWDDYTSNPVLGSGPGSYEQYWNRHRPIRHIVRDAHSLYLETLAELGPLGLLLLVLALGAPVAAAFLARGQPLVPTALAAYSAYLVHAGVDWDWELAAITVAALAVGAALLAAAERDGLLPPLGLFTRIGATVAALALSVFALVGLVGASALSAGESALDKGDYGKARTEAKKASRWWDWSADPWQQLGDAQAAAGDTAGARASYRKAIEKDRGDWLLWYDLSSVSDGDEAKRALAEAARLNPFYRFNLGEPDAPA